MATVEELREAILSEARGIQEHGFDTDIPRTLESLIAAEHEAGYQEGRRAGLAKGRQEGAEQERHKWENETLKALLNPDVSIEDKLKAAGDPLACVSPFASALAPDTKEKP